MLVRTLILAAALALVTTVPSGADVSASAQLRQDWAPSYQARGERGGQQFMSARQVVEIVRSRFGGEPIGAPRLEQNGDRAFYVLSWRFPNEVVREVRVDAVSGQVN